jgi:hypothetical protein
VTGLYLGASSTHSGSDLSAPLDLLFQPQKLVTDASALLGHDVLRDCHVDGLGDDSLD